jgi:thymidylate kinase
MIISFSGIHGSGKTTLAQYAVSFLLKKGLNVRLVHLQDFAVADLTKKLFRISSKSRYKIEGGKKISNQKEYNNSPLYLFLRLFSYYIDLFFFIFLYILNFRDKNKVYIYDRYFYDKITNFNLTNPFFYTYWKLYSFFIPKPDLKFLIDIDGRTAYNRKPEYSLAYFQQIANSYDLVKKSTNFIVIDNKEISESKKVIQRHLKKLI